MHKAQTAKATFRHANTLKVWQLNTTIISYSDKLDVTLAVNQRANLTTSFVRQLAQLSGELLRHDLLWWNTARIQLLDSTYLVWFEAQSIS
jgi:hypothetical protein